MEMVVMISPYAHQFLKFIANIGCLAQLRCRNIVARAELHPEPDTTAFLANPIPMAWKKYAVGLSYYGVINLRDYLFTILESLNLGIFDAQWRQDRVERAKKILTEVRSLEANNYPKLAEA
jgi:hypothetical protein